MVLVDLGRTALVQELLTGELTKRIDSVVQVSQDYRNWLDASPVVRSTGTVSFGLICKVLDMGSQFTIRPLLSGELPAPPAVPEWFVSGARSPVRILAPDGQGPEHLMVSPLRLSVQDGHVVAQPALSDYFDAMASVSSNSPLRAQQRGSVSLPVRTFNPTTLVTAHGESVVTELLRRVDYALIEDADLRPADLLAHLEQFQAKNVVLYNMTEAMGLTGNYAYVLWKRSGPNRKLAGERLA